jgi:hypothetical protein
MIRQQKPGNEPATKNRKRTGNKNPEMNRQQKAGNHPATKNGNDPSTKNRK